MTKPRALIEQAKQLFEARSGDTEPVEKRSIDATELAGVALMMAGKYREVQALGNAIDAPSERMRELIAWAFIGEAGELAERAKAVDPAEADRLFDLAGQKYQAALAIKPDMHEALNSWGNALQAQAKTKTKSGDDADRLLTLAGEKHQAALTIKPDMHEALDNWGAALLTQAGMSRGEKQVRLLDEAAEKLARALELDPVGPLYNLACLHALRGDEDGAREHLLAAKRHGRLPDRAHLEADSDLAGLRGRPWFERLLADLGGAEPDAKAV